MFLLISLAPLKVTRETPTRGAPLVLLEPDKTHLLLIISALDIIFKYASILARGG